MIAGIQRMIATSGPCFVSILVAVNMIGIRMNRMSTMYHAVGFSTKLLMRIINTVRASPTAMIVFVAFLSIYVYSTVCAYTSVVYCVYW